MSEELIAGIVKHINQGDGREFLRKEVLAAGYDLAEFTAAYAEALKRSNPKTLNPTPSDTTVEITTTETEFLAANVDTLTQPITVTTKPDIPIAPKTPAAPGKILVTVAYGGFVLLLAAALFLGIILQIGPLSFLSKFFLVV